MQQLALQVAPAKSEFITPKKCNNNKTFSSSNKKQYLNLHSPIPVRPRNYTQDNTTYKARNYNKKSNFITFSHQKPGVNEDKDHIINDMFSKQYSNPSGFFKQYNTSQSIRDIPPFRSSALEAHFRRSLDDNEEVEELENNTNQEIIKNLMGSNPSNTSINQNNEPINSDPSDDNDTDSSPVLKIRTYTKSINLNNERGFLSEKKDLSKSHVQFSTKQLIFEDMVQRTKNPQINDKVFLKNDKNCQNLSFDTDSVYKELEKSSEIFFDQNNNASSYYQGQSAENSYKQKDINNILKLESSLETKCSLQCQDGSQNSSLKSQFSSDKN